MEEERQRFGKLKEVKKIKTGKRDYNPGEVMQIALDCVARSHKSVWNQFKKKEKQR